MKNLIFSVAAALVPAPTTTACPTHGSVSTASTRLTLPTATAWAATDTPILRTISTALRPDVHACGKPACCHGPLLRHDALCK